jgi:2-keto-4-pentenoate hydratase/2-oxohepta-3-ene-1,7-dioic acid hydratase in catechol pathway
MRFATYRHRGEGDDRLGLLEGDRLLGLAPGTTLLDLLGGGQAQLVQVGRAGLDDPFESVALEEVELCAPIPRPPSIRDFLAFEEHLRNARGVEVDRGWYEQPIFYFSNPAGVRGPYDDIEIAPGSAEWDYELELAAVIGAPGSNLSPRIHRDVRLLGAGPATARDATTARSR